MKTKKRNAIPRKLVLNREMLRTLSAEALEEVAGGDGPLSAGATTAILTGITLH